jgi:hypothetical protein
MSVAGTLTVICVAVCVTGVSAGFVPKLTVELAMKFVPVSVNVNVAPPAVALVGLIDVSVGAGFAAELTVKFAGADVPPPGVGFVTVTGNVPAVAISAAVMAAVTCVELTNVVVAAVPLNFTAEVETKPVPFTVSVNAAPPAVAPEGESDVIVGAGLLTVKLLAAEVPPPGAAFVTVTGKVPAVAMAVAGIVAVTSVVLTNVVVAAVPLKLTAEPLTKPVPVTVSVNAAPPAVALEGESDVIVGAGLFTVKFDAVEVPPPGAGLVTVTGNVPAVAMAVAGIAAVTCVELTNVVVAAVPLKFTTEVLMKPVPFTVRVKAAPPAVALEGDSEVMVGTGFPADVENVRWKFVVPPSPRNADTMK